MRAFLSHGSALAYWREHFPLDLEIGRPAQTSGVQQYAYCKDDVAACVPEWWRPEDGKLDILVFDKALRRPSCSVTSHLWTGALPEGSFYRDGDAYVASPEFLFLQMASELSIVQLIALGCELCGTYVLQPARAANRGVPDPDRFPTRVAPLTNIGKLQEFVAAAAGAKSLTKARRAIRYLVEGSQSPMETMTYMLFCLPPLLGGYGLPKPTMNARIDLDAEAQLIARRRYCKGDLCWPEKLLNVEYHGEVHVGASHMKSDVGRELGIERMGFRVLTITSTQVFDQDQFEVVAIEAARWLKHRLRSSTLGNTQARWGLRDELAQWMSA